MRSFESTFRIDEDGFYFLPIFAECPGAGTFRKERYLDISLRSITFQVLIANEVLSACSTKIIWSAFRIEYGVVIEGSASQEGEFLLPDGDSQ